MHLSGTSNKIQIKKITLGVIFMLHFRQTIEVVCKFEGNRTLNNLCLKHYLQLNRENSVVWTSVQFFWWLGENFACVNMFTSFGNFHRKCVEEIWREHTTPFLSSMAPSSCLWVLQYLDTVLIPPHYQILALSQSFDLLLGAIHTSSLETSTALQTTQMTPRLTAKLKRWSLFDSSAKTGTLSLQ